MPTYTSYAQTFSYSTDHFLTQCASSTIRKCHKVGTVDVISQHSSRSFSTEEYKLTFSFPDTPSFISCDVTILLVTNTCRREPLSKPALVTQLWLWTYSLLI